MRPASIIGIEGLHSTLSRDLIETRFRNGQLRAAVYLNQTKRDKCRSFIGVIMVGVDGEGMPAKGEASHGRQLLDKDFKRLPGVRFLKSRDVRVNFRRNDPAVHSNTCDKRTVEFDAEPCAEARGIADSLPYSLDRRFEKHLLFDLVRVHDQTFIIESVYVHRVWLAPEFNAANPPENQSRCEGRVILQRPGDLRAGTDCRSPSVAQEVPK